MSAASGSFGVALASRRGLVALVLMGLAATVAVGIFDQDFYPIGESAVSTAGTAGDELRQGVNSVKSVADMLLGRSPGERTAGALADLKHKRTAAPHQRALAKTRKSASPRPLAAIVGSPATVLAPVAEAPPAAMPLYNLLSGSPAVAQAPPPSLFPAMPPPPSGGGFVVPPVVTQVIPPAPPPVTGVPEPGSWAMMLIGFAVMSMFRRVSNPAVAAS